MEAQSIIISNESELILFGASFVKNYKGGDIILLKGDLGAGKTTITKGFAKGLGVKEVVKSPTFTYMQIYETTNHPDVEHMIHIDTYRAKNTEQLQDIGVGEYILDNKNISIIEWPEKIYPLIKDKPYTEISIEHTPDNKRRITTKHRNKK